jgi:hypothetical protein
MRTFALLLTLLSITTTGMSIEHAVPTNRSELKDGEWFPYVISKIAPLERWRFATSPEDLRKSDFASDFEYQSAIRDSSSFPRFCFSLFRPKPELWRALLAAVENQTGPVFWQFNGDCLAAYPRKLTFMAPITSDEDIREMMRRIEEAQRNPPQPDLEFVKKAMADIPRFCGYLEHRLALIDKEPEQFDPAWLTREGLRSHPAQFEDFIESGSWSVALTRNPNSDSRSQLKDIYLNFGISAWGAEKLLKSLGADWDKYVRSGNSGPIVAEYPILSQFDDETADVIVSPKQVQALLKECFKAEGHVKDAPSIRVLDKFIRIARWAEKLQVGIYFGGQ